MTALSGNTFLERRWLLFVLLAVAVRWGYVEMKVDDMRPEDAPGRWYFETPDTHSYIDPVEELYASGTYYPDYRMPGVGVPYGFFRLFFDRDGSLDAMVVFQCLMSALSVYLLALIGLRFSGSVRTATVLYILALISTYSCWYDTSMSSDSLAVSVMVIHVFLLQRAIDRHSWMTLVAAGLFLAWIIFLRPVASLLLVPAAYLVWRYWGNPRSAAALALFLVPFAVLDGAWTLRNWLVHGGFNPLTNEGIMPDEIDGRPRGYLMRFLQGYGGNYIWWEAGSDIRWFGMWEGSAAQDNEGREAQAPPDYAYVQGYNKDSLLALSERIRVFNAGGLPAPDSLAIVAEINGKLDRYTKLYKEGAPWNYNVLSRFRMVQYLLTQNGTETLFRLGFNHLPRWKQVFKLLQMGLYLFSYWIGGLAVIVLLLLWRRARSIVALWVPVIVAYMVFIYPLGLRMAEWRFMVHVHPLILLLATCFTMSQLGLLRDYAKRLSQLRSLEGDAD